MDHDVRDLQIAQVQDAAEHVGIAFGYRSFFGLQINGAANFFMRRQNICVIIGLAGCKFEQLPDDKFDSFRGRHQHPNHAAHDRRDH